MARTTINSLGIPADTIVSADLDYPLTDFSSTGIDDNASSTSLTIDSSGNISVTGTVDGRDLATDGTKLDGIAASATNYGDSDVATYISGNRSYGNITTTGYIAGPSTFTIDPAAVGDNTGTLVIAGNLQVDGTTTTINSTTVNVDDLNIQLATGAANAAAANGAGITVDGASATLTYYSTPDAWSFNKNVGIGTSSPSAKLHVKGGSGEDAELRLFPSDGTMDGVISFTGQGDNTSDEGAQIWYDNDAGDLHIVSSYDNAAGGIRFHTRQPGHKQEGNERLTITGDGDVGIGTAIPDAPLTVQPQSGAAGTHDNQSWSYSISAGAEFDLKLKQVVSSGLVKYTFDLRNAGTSYNNNLVFDRGNVGIGTDAPSVLLDISGTGQNLFSGSLYNARTKSSTVGQGILFGYHTGTGYGGLIAGDAVGGSENNLIFGGYSGSVWQEVMRIKGGGNVGIGNTNPTNKLAIGTNLGTGYVITAASTSQYGMVLQTTESTPSNNATFWVRSEDSNGVNTVFRVNNNGRVGINTSSMDGQLHVKGTTNRTVKIDPTFSSGTWTSLAFARNGTDLWRTFQNSSDQYLSFYNDQSSLYQLTLRNTGYVGINQLAPFSPLHIDKITETAVYTPTNFNSQPTITLVHSNTNGQYNGTRYTNTAGNYEWFTGSVQTGVNYADFVFQGYNRYASAYQEHVRITEKGRIGIGDGNPETPLHIKITNKLGSTFTGSTRGEGITVEQTNYGSGNYISLIEAPYDDDGHPVARIGAKFTGSGSSIVMGTSNSYASGVTNQSFEMDPSGFTVLGNTSNGAFTQLHVHALQSNYGPITARSNSYTTIWSILPWSSAITYMSSGIYYANGGWVHQSSSTHNCLLGTSGSTGIRWYASSNSSGSWNLAQDVQLFNTAGQLTASSASDERLKENIVDYTIADALTKVNALRPVSFEWNDTIKRKKGTEYSDGTHVGFIAQEVETVFPEACLISDVDEYDADSPFDLDPDDTYYGDIRGVRAEKMVPILVGAIKELTRRLEILENA